MRSPLLFGARPHSRGPAARTSWNLRSSAPLARLSVPSWKALAQALAMLLKPPPLVGACWTLLHTSPTEVSTGPSSGTKWVCNATTARQQKRFQLVLYRVTTGHFCCRAVAKVARCHAIQKNREALGLPGGGRMHIYVVPEHVLTTVDDMYNNATHVFTSGVGFDSTACVYGKAFQEAG